MSKLRNWFQHQKNNNARFVSVQDLFFGQKKTAYIFYRVKLFNLKNLIHYAFFCFFFISSYKGLSYHSFSIIALLVLIQNALFSFWWGALETMRTRVRHDYYAHDNNQLNQNIGHYLLLSLLVAIALWALGYFIWIMYIKKSNFTFLLQNFILFYFIYSPMMLIVRSFHTGIYAITRIVRTPLSIMIPDLLGLLTLCLLYPILNEHAPLYAIITQSVSGLILQLKFVSRMYEFYDVTPILPRAGDFIKWLIKFPILEFLIAGLSFFCINADIVLIAIITYFMQTGLISNQIFATIFLIHPIIAASTDWAILFYFDRKRVRSNDFKKMITFYDQMVGKAALVFALFYWLIAVIATLLIISPKAAIELILFLPFFIVKSKLADLEIKTFSYNFYFDLLLVNGWFVFVGVIIYFINIPFLYSYFIALLAIVIGIKLLKKPIFKKIEVKNFYKLPISFFSFLHQLTITKELPLTLYYFSFVKNIHSHQKFYILDMIAYKFLRSNEDLCIISDLECLFFTKKRTIHRYALFNASSGLLRSIEKKEIFCLEHLTHLALNRTDFFSKFLPPMPVKIFSIDEIKQEFFKLFPKGIYFSPEPELGPEAIIMPIEDTRELYIKALGYLFYTYKPIPSDYEINVYYVNNQIEGIFAIIKRDYYTQRISYWHRFLLEQNIWGCFLNTDIVQSQ